MDVLPNPVFEGSEKRVEICFSATAHAPASGLRSLPRARLDELMTLAACCIVSARSNTHLDAYVLSESSLFVYPHKWVLKTCGTTRLLNAVPRLLELAAQIGLVPCRCKFTRASFLFPEQQLFPHTSFDDEVEFLQSQFSSLNGGGRAYVLGDGGAGLQWHVYVAEHPLIAAPHHGAPTFNLEVVMTELAPNRAVQFFRNDSFQSAAHTTQSTGIGALKPAALVDDYVFEPCGYSMNGIDKTGLMTIHVTPEEGQSYASVEVSGFGDDMVCPNNLISKVAHIFQPGRMAVALSVDRHVGDTISPSWGQIAAVPLGYECHGAATQPHGAGGRVSYYTFGGMSAGTEAGAASKGGAASGDAPGSPSTVLGNNASFLSVNTSSDSDGDVMVSSEGDMTSDVELEAVVVAAV